MIKLELPLTREKTASLCAGDRVLLSGALYTARDAAHQRLIGLLDAGGQGGGAGLGEARPASADGLPFPLQDACIYYVGPTPAAPGQVIGSAGPTTSYRMDAWTPRLLALGLRGMIGKGERSGEVIAAMKQAGAVYFAALGGAGALLSSRIKSSEVIAFPDLGTEAVRRLVVEGFPVTVVIDAEGRNLYSPVTRNERLAAGFSRSFL